MKRPTGSRIAVLLVLGLFLAVGVGAGCPDLEEPEESVSCDVRTEALDWGTVAVDPIYADTQFIDVANPASGGQLLVWIDPSHGCPGIAITDASDTVARNAEDGTLSVAFDPHEAGDLACTLGIRGSPLSSPGEEVGCSPVQLSGTAALPTLDVQPSAIDFGTVEAGSVRDTFVELTRAVRYSPAVYAWVDPAFECAGVAADMDTITISWENEPDTLRIGYAPTEPGVVDCALPILCETDARALSCPSVDLSGTGVLSAAVWSNCNDGSVDRHLRGVYGLASDEVYAVGDAGLLVKHTGACQWQDLQTGADTVDLVGVWAAPTDTTEAPNFWLVGNDSIPQMYTNMGTILSSDDASQWTVETYSSFFDFRAVWGSGECSVYFTGMGVSTDFPNAQRYTCATDSLDDFIIDLGMSDVTGVGGSGPDNVWAVLRQVSYQVYTGSDTTLAVATESWMDQPLHDVWVTASGHVYAVGEQGAIYHRDGEGWTDETREGETRAFLGVWAAETGEVIAVGEGGMIYRYDGSRWAEESPGVSGDLHDVWGASATDVFVVGDDSIILRYAVP